MLFTIVYIVVRFIEEKETIDQVCMDTAADIMIYIVMIYTVAQASGIRRNLY